MVAKKKPSPDIYLLAKDTMGLDPARYAQAHGQGGAAEGRLLHRLSSVALQLAASCVAALGLGGADEGLWFPHEERVMCQPRD